MINEFGDLTLKSRIIRTGLWESQQNDLNSIYDRYDRVASSGVGLITSELYSIYPKDKFVEHSFMMDSLNFMTMASKVAEICHSLDVPILGKWNSSNTIVELIWIFRSMTLL